MKNIYLLGQYFLCDIVINLPAIEFKATVANCKYPIILFDNPTKPYASTPNDLTINGVSKKLIPI